MIENTKRYDLLITPAQWGTENRCPIVFGEEASQALQNKKFDLAHNKAVEELITEKIYVSSNDNTNAGKHRRIQVSMVSHKINSNPNNASNASGIAFGSSEHVPVTDTIQKNNALYRVSVQNNKMIREKKLCNFNVVPVRIVHRLQIDSDNNPKISERWIEADVLRENSSHKSRITVRFEDVDKIADICAKTDIFCIVEPSAQNAKSHIAVHFRKQAELLPIFTEIKFTGWQQFNGKYCYLHDGILDCKLPTNIKSQSGLSIKSSNQPPQAAAEAAKLVLTLSDNSAVIVPLFLFAHLGILCSLFNKAGFPPQFVMFLNGSTGTFKTSAAKLLFNWYNDDYNDVKHSFKDTVTATEVAFYRYRDSIMLIDDFHPSINRTESKAMTDMLEKIIRFFGDGTTKHRSNANLEEVKGICPQGLCVMTGEYRMGTESTALRTFELMVQKGTFRSNVLTQLKEQVLEWHCHLLSFADYVGLQYDALTSRIKNDCENVRNRLNHGTLYAARTIQTTAVLIATAHIVMDYLCYIGAYSLNEAQQLLAEWEKALYTAAELSEGRSKSTDPAIMYLYAIAKLINEKRFALAANIQQYREDPSKYYGYIDKDSWKLEPDKIYKAVCDYYKMINCTISIPQAELHKRLHEHGATLAQKEQSGGKTTTKYLYKTSLKDRPRYLALLPNELHRLVKEVF